MYTVLLCIQFFYRTYTCNYKNDWSIFPTNLYCIIFIEWLIDSLIDSLIHGLIYWLIDSLIAICFTRWQECSIAGKREADISPDIFDHTIPVRGNFLVNSVRKRRTRAHFHTVEQIVVGKTRYRKDHGTCKEEEKECFRFRGKTGGRIASAEMSKAIPL